VDRGLRQPEPRARERERERELRERWRGVTGRWTERVSSPQLLRGRRPTSTLSAGASSTFASPSRRSLRGRSPCSSRSSSSRHRYCMARLIGLRSLAARGLLAPRPPLSLATAAAAAAWPTVRRSSFESPRPATDIVGRVSVQSPKESRGRLSRQRSHRPSRASGERSTTTRTTSSGWRASTAGCATSPTSTDSCPNFSPRSASRSSR
jgi:hypothetical protein